MKKEKASYFTCLLTNLVISNIVTVFFPPKTALSLSSALMLVFFFLSCRLFFLMYAHSFLVTSVRGMALVPTTALRAASGCTGFMKAAFGLRFFFVAIVPPSGSKFVSGVIAEVRYICQYFFAFLLVKFEFEKGLASARHRLDPPPLHNPIVRARSRYNPAGHPQIHSQPDAQEEDLTRRRQGAPGAKDRPFAGGDRQNEREAALRSWPPG